jgi:hypothetical protein
LKLYNNIININDIPFREVVSGVKVLNKKNKRKTTRGLSNPFRVVCIYTCSPPSKINLFNFQTSLVAWE